MMGNQYKIETKFEDFDVQHVIRSFVPNLIINQLIDLSTILCRLLRGI